MQTLNVDLDVRYPIHIGEGLLERADLILPHIRGKKVAIVTNTTVAPLYLATLQNALQAAGIAVVPIILPDGEQYKNLETLNLIYDALLENRCDRGVTLIALGGGVIGDMTGFAAASYQRGVDFIQVPTTLLAQVDSSVGGKTGINHRLGKNMIGAFWQPRLVLADTLTLSTLPDRELSAGLAEVIKYGLIQDAEFFHWLEQNIDALLAREPAALASAIYRSCQDKAWVVAQDEKEGGLRAILNLGHTFGHAVENQMGYGNWLHGEAVAAGTVMAARLSKLLGWIGEAEESRIRDLLVRARLPVTPPVMPQAQWISLMGLDKKVANGRLRFILLKSIGHAVIDDSVPADLLAQCLEGFGATR